MHIPVLGYGFDNVGGDSFAVFSKLISCLIIYDFTIKGYNQFKSRLNLLLTITYMNQNRIDHNDISSNPAAKILPPSLVYPPTFFIFLPSYSLWDPVISKAHTIFRLLLFQSISEHLFIQICSSCHFYLPLHKHHTCLLGNFFQCKFFSQRQKGGGCFTIFPKIFEAKLTKNEWYMFKYCDKYWWSSTKKLVKYLYYKIT